VQVGEKIINLLLCEYLFEALHFAPAEANDVAHTFVISRKATLGQVLLLEHSFDAGSLAAAIRIRCMTSVAMLIVDVATRCLLRSQPKLGVASPALDFATGKRETKKHQAAALESSAPNRNHFLEFAAASTMLSITSFKRFAGKLKLLVKIENAICSPFAVTT
jgi:hypothetical protein